jgi:hypothetical protein
MVLAEKTNPMYGHEERIGARPELYFAVRHLEGRNRFLPETGQSIADEGQYRTVQN